MREIRLVRSRWHPGRAAAYDGPVLVTLTDFTAARSRDLPGIARAGFRLRRHWPVLEGAVGVWLWASPQTRRVGSVAVWTDTPALHGFVGLPDHVAIMRRYRDRGTARSVSWTADRAVSADELSALWSDAHVRLTAGTTPN